ncbi:MAG: right-handed parallel beta-helix repeat-containing protein [Candidatus Competibacteraceae bacterium]|nr:right-handed parallel beta-helix repeat-containing protein [Candidatus Competibacteraceae bacterium]
MAIKYVNAQGGSNAGGDGSSGSPWQTWAYAQQQATSGDTIYLRGTLREQLSVTKSLTVKNWSGYTATVDGAASAEQAALNVYKYPEGGNLVKYGDYSPYGFSEGHVWDGLLDISADNVTVEGLFVTHSRGRAISVHDCSTVSLKDISGASNRHAILGTVNTDGVTIDGGLWTDNINYAPWSRPANLLNFPGCVNTRNDTNITVKNMTIKGGWGSGIIMLVVTNATVQGNKVENVWRPGINVSLADNCTIRDNYVYYTNASGTTITGAAYGGIAVFPETGFEPWTGSDTVYIYNNIVVGAQAGLWLGGNEGMSVNDLFVYNNSFLDSILYGLDVRREYHDLVFANNIVSSQKGIAVRLTRGDLTTKTVKNNLWYGDKPISGWQGSGDIYNQNPLLINPGGTIGNDNPVTRYFVSSSSSPAINAGTSTISASPSVSAPSTDYRGATRSGNPDIGAHEYDGTITTVTNCSGNVLTNQAFSSGTTGWSSADCTFTVSGGVARMQGDGTGFAQIYQSSLAVDSGATYGVEFDAKAASANTTIRVQVLQNGTPFANLGVDQAFTLTTSMARYTLEFVANATEIDTRFRFYLPNVGDVNIDNVCFYEGQPADPGGGGTGGGGTTATGEGDVVIRVAASSSGANTTTVSVRDEDLIVAPKALLSLAGIAGASARMSLGFAAGTQIGGGFRCQDAQTSTDTRSRVTSTSIIQILDDNTTNPAHSLTASLVTGGVDYGKSATPEAAADVLSLMFAGDDVQSYTGTFQSSSSNGGTASVTGLGFRPNLVFFLGFNYPFTQENTTQHARLSLGIATGSEDQYCYMFTDFNGDNPSDVRGRLSTDCIHFYANDSQKVSVSSFDSDGFTVSTADATGSKDLCYLALRVDNATIALETFTSPTTTSTKSIDVGFTPQMALLLQTRLTTLDSTNTGNQAGIFSLGLLDDTNEKSISIRSRDAISPSDTETYVSTDAINVYTHQGVSEQVANAALTATGLDLVYSAVMGTATYGLLLAIEYVEPPRRRVRQRKQRQGVGMGLRLGF